MNLLTDDMIAAINDADITDTDKQLIKDILYQERQNKERVWDNDAEKHITKLIDESSSQEAV